MLVVGLAVFQKHPVPGVEALGALGVVLGAEPELHVVAELHPAVDVGAQHLPVPGVIAPHRFAGVEIAPGAASVEPVLRQVVVDLAAVEDLALAVGVVPVLDPQGGGAVVGGVEEPEVVEVQPVALPADPGGAADVPAQLAEGQVSAGAVDVARIGLVRRGRLGVDDGAHEGAGEPVGPIPELEIEVEPAGVGLPGPVVAEGLAVPGLERRGAHDVDAVVALA